MQVSSGVSGVTLNTAAVPLSSALRITLFASCSFPATLVSCSRGRLLVLTSETLELTDHSALRGSEFGEHSDFSLGNPNTSTSKELYPGSCKDPFPSF